jgi:hypothetical protein
MKNFVLKTQSWWIYSTADFSETLVVAATQVEKLVELATVLFMASSTPRNKSIHIQLREYSSLLLSAGPERFEGICSQQLQQSFPTSISPRIFKFSVVFRTLSEFRVCAFPLKKHKKETKTQKDEKRLNP